VDRMNMVKAHESCLECNNMLTRLIR